MQKGFIISDFSDDLIAIALSTAEQRLLQTNEIIGMKRTRRSTSATGELIEYSEAIYNTNRHPYRITYEV